MVCLVLIGTVTFADTTNAPTKISTELKSDALLVMSENTLVATSNLLYRYESPIRSLAMVEGQKGEINSIDLIDLSNCVERLESGANPLAYNSCDTDGREKFGLYQFGQLEWDTLCSGDKWNADDQRECFKTLYMLGQGWRWPSVKRCINKLI
jgi:hypothetical protein